MDCSSRLEAMSLVSQTCTVCVTSPTGRIATVPRTVSIRMPKYVTCGTSLLWLIVSPRRVIRATRESYDAHPDVVTNIVNNGKTFLMHDIPDAVA